MKLRLPILPFGENSKVIVYSIPEKSGINVFLETLHDLKPSGNPIIVPNPDFIPPFDIIMVFSMNKNCNVGTLISEIPIFKNGDSSRVVIAKSLPNFSEMIQEVLLQILLK